MDKRIFGCLAPHRDWVGGWLMGVISQRMIGWPDDDHHLNVTAATLLSTFLKTWYVYFFPRINGYLDDLLLTLTEWMDDLMCVISQRMIGWSDDRMTTVTLLSRPSPYCHDRHLTATTVTLLSRPSPYCHDRHLTVTTVTLLASIFLKKWYVFFHGWTDIWMTCS